MARIKDIIMYAIEKSELALKVKAGTATDEELDRWNKLRTLGIDAYARPERETISIQTMIMLLMIVKLSKTPKGLEVIKTLGKEFIKGIFDTLQSLGQASAANKVSSWANPVLISAVLDRFGFVNPDFTAQYHLGLSVITGAGVAEGFLDTIQGFFPFSSPEPSEYPSNIVYSARVEGGTVTKEEITARPTKKELEELRSLLKGD